MKVLRDTVHMISEFKFRAFSCISVIRESSTHEMAERIVFVSVKIGHNAPSNPFSVRVVNPTTVHGLKKSVKTELLSDLNGIDAYHLEVSSSQSISGFISCIMHLIDHIFICIGILWCR